MLQLFIYHGILQAQLLYLNFAKITKLKNILQKFNKKCKNILDKLNQVCYNQS